MTTNRRTRFAQILTAGAAATLLTLAGAGVAAADVPAAGASEFGQTSEFPPPAEHTPAQPPFYGIPPTGP